MKQRLRDRVLSTVLALFICALALAGTALSYFTLRGVRGRTVAGTAESVPYTPPAPETLTVLLRVDLLKTYDILIFDCLSGRLTATTLPPGTTAGEAETFAGNIDRTLILDADGLAALLDRFDGVRLTLDDGKTLRLTGAQVVSGLQTAAEQPEALQTLREASLLSFFERVATRGFSDDDFLFLTEHATTDLGYPDYYDRKTQLPALCGSCAVENR